jgi:hypothetical protein
MPTKFDLSHFVTRKHNHRRASRLSTTETMAITHPKWLTNRFEFGCTTKAAARSFLGYLVHIQSPNT